MSDVKFKPEWYVDQGQDRPTIELEIWIHVIEEKKAKVGFILGDETLGTTFQVPYYIDGNLEYPLSPENCAILMDAPQPVQLFIVDKELGKEMQNSRVVFALMEEAFIYRAIKTFGKNQHRIVIMESKYAGERENRWTIYLPERIQDKSVTMMSGLMKLMGRV